MPGCTTHRNADRYRCPLKLKPDSCGAECLDYIENKILVHLVSPDEVAPSSSSPSRVRAGHLRPGAVSLQRLSALTKQHGMLLVADEVQCGMGRTGRMFACEHFGLRPDVITLAKGSFRHAAGDHRGPSRGDGLPPGAHASTFGGNLVSCAAALATIKLFARVPRGECRDGRRLSGKRGYGDLATRHPLIGDVRGKGLMVGVELVRNRETKERAVTERDYVVDACFRRGLLLLGAGLNTLRFSPPLVLTTDQADIALHIVDEALTEVEHERR